MGTRNSRELDTLGEIMDRLAVGEFGRAADLVTQRFKTVEMALHDGDWTRAPHQPGRGGAHCPRAQGRDEAQALSRRRGRHEEQGQEHAGRQREGCGQGPREGEGRQEERRLRQPDHAARREGPLQEGDGEGERERKGVDCELAGGLDALMLDAFGASVLDDTARPEKGMLLDDGQVDAINSEFLERLSSGFHAAPDLTAWRTTLGMLEKRTSLSEVLEALHVGLDAPSSPRAGVVLGQLGTLQRLGE